MMDIRLNTLSANSKAKFRRKRVGRGAASGWGKTCGKGHKGQKARSGGGVRAGFEGGQMPLQMRLPKFGFNSRLQMITQQLRTSELNQCEAGEVNFATLKSLGLLKNTTRRVRVFFSGDVQKAFVINGLHVTKGAKIAIEKAGGSVA